MSNNKTHYSAKEIENQIFELEGVKVRIRNEDLTFTKRYDECYSQRLWTGSNLMECEVRFENFIKEARSDRESRDKIVSIAITNGIPFEELSNFEQDSLLNTVAGNEENGGWEAVHRQFPIVEEEFEEIKTAIALKNPLMLRDAIADTLVTVYGLAYVAGIDADTDHLCVTQSNFSKFDKSTEDAKKTLDKYKALGVDVKTVMTTLKDAIRGHAIHETYYIAISTKDQTDIKGKFYPKGKFLKSYLWKEPNFEPLDPNNLLNSSVSIES